MRGDKQAADPFDFLVLYWRTVLHGVTFSGVSWQYGEKRSLLSARVQVLPGVAL